MPERLSPEPEPEIVIEPTPCHVSEPPDSAGRGGAVEADGVGIYAYGVARGIDGVEPDDASP